MEIKDLILVFLGWLLGILAGPIANRLKKDHDRRALRSGLLLELEDVRSRLAHAVFQIEMDRKGPSKDLFEWFRPFASASDLFSGDFGGHSTLPLIEKILTIPDEEFVKVTKQMRKNSASFALKRIECRYLTSKLGELSLLSDKEQILIFSFLTHINFASQIVSDSEFYRSLTFDSGISEVNHAIAKTEQNNSENNYSSQVKIAANIATEIITILKRSD